MSRPRDTQRAKLYRAEREVFARPGQLVGSTFESLAECQEYVDKVQHSRWWRRGIGRHHTRQVVVLDGRGRRAACAEGRYRVKLPRWSRQPWVVLHELAHTVTLAPTEPAHGRLFAQRYLALVRRFLGAEAAAELRAAFKRNHVHWRAYQPKPQLAARMKAASAAAPSPTFFWGAAPAACPECGWTRKNLHGACANRRCPSKAGIEEYAAEVEGP